MMNVDLTSTMDYWNWVRSTESLLNLEVVMKLMGASFMLRLSFQNLRNSSLPK